jgi:DNA (cytosine-5)-methyltransferase 1
MSSIKVLDLFSGCGGLVNGLVQSKLDVVLSNEYWKPAHNTNLLNHTNTEHIIGDITDDEVKKSIIKKSKKLGVNVITGGPPCQAYSNAGKKDQFDTRGQLYRDYMYIVKELKPEMCIMENVKGILSMTHLKDILTEKEEKILEEYKEIEKKWSECENKESKKILTKEKSKQYKLLQKDCNEYVTVKIHRKFKELGYESQHKVLNSADFGCPQRRQRVIFIAVKKKYKIIFPIQTHSESDHKNFKKWVTVKEAIDDLKDIPDDIDSSHIRSKHTPGMVKRMDETKYEHSAQPKYKEAYFKCHPDKPSLTVKENHGAVFVHYEKPRCMTARELARLQTFPDTFKFTGSKKDILIQIGNAIPCLLGKHIGKNIHKILNYVSNICD